MAGTIHIGHRIVHIGRFEQQVGPAVAQKGAFGRVGQHDDAAGRSFVRVPHVGAVDAGGHQFGHPVVAREVPPGHPDQRHVHSG